MNAIRVSIMIGDMKEMTSGAFSQFWSILAFFTLEFISRQSKYSLIDD